MPLYVFSDNIIAGTATYYIHADSEEQAEECLTHRLEDGEQPDEVEYDMEDTFALTDTFETE